MLTRYSHLYTDLLLIASLLLPCFAIAKPAINTVTGDITNNTTLIISGSGFTTKANPKPLFWWKADFGQTPSALGRKTSWDETGSIGSFSTKVVAPGSKQSVGKDHSFGGAALSRVKFNSDRLYLYRKTYEDFDISKDWIFNEEKGFKTFNFKTIRFWSPKVGGTNNMHMNAQGRNNNAFSITPEFTDGTTFSKSFTENRLYQIPKKWKVEEIEYKTSSIGIKDGIWRFYQNGTLGTDNKFRNRTTKYPDRYAIVFQSQVSHGAQPGSIMYYDSLYMDDTWHRVVICKSQTWAACGGSEIQIPTKWTNTEIRVNLNLGGLDPKSALFLYVVDKNGVSNTNGYALALSLCPKCPLPPTLK